jgi:hypothetical protein
VARARTRGEDADLAAIVLGRTQAAERRFDAPERVPAWVDRAPARGYDARSLAVLALVVAAFAATIGWVTSIGDEPRVPAASSGREEPATKATGTADEPDLVAAFGARGAAAERATESATAAPSAAPGPNLVAGRIVASRSGSGAGLVAVSVRNAGDSATPASGTQVLVLADGAVMGTGELGSVAAGASAKVEVPLDWCPAGTVALVAVLDPSSAVREADERDNAISRSASFGC